MMNKHTKTFNTRLLKGRSVYSHNLNNHKETDVLQEQQNMQSINSSLRFRDFFGQENLASIFLVALFKQGFFGCPKQSEDFPHLPDAEKITSAGMMNKHTKTFNTRLLKGRSVYSHNLNNHKETDVLQEQQNMQSINSSLRNRVIAWDPLYARTH